MKGFSGYSLAKILKNSGDLLELLPSVESYRHVKKIFLSISDRKHVMKYFYYDHPKHSDSNEKISLDNLLIN